MADERTADLRLVRQALLNAGDDKVRGIVAIVDGVADPRMNAAILDPVRPRLALIRPARPLRFARLLFIPLDPVIVPARGWREGQAAVPRSVLPCLARFVQSDLGGVSAEVEAKIAHGTSEREALISEAGALLWPHAAAALDGAAAPPPDWDETGLRPGLFPLLAKAIAAVLRRASLLRAIAHDPAGEGAVEVNGLLENLAEESELGHAMIVRVLLKRAPRAADMLWQTVNTGWSPADRISMRKALALGREAVLADLEAEGGFSAEIGQSSLPVAAEEARRTAALLTVMADDPMSIRDRPRVAAIRRALDQACRARIQSAIEDELAAPLAAITGHVDHIGQIRLETSARALRALEMSARPLGLTAGDAEVYDTLIGQAVSVVREASAALTLVRQCRLIEILSGPETAEALYHERRQAGAFIGA